MACIACCFLRHRTNVPSAPKPTTQAEPFSHLSKSQGSGITSEPCHQNNIPHPMLNQMLARMKWASEQMADRVEPCDDADVKSDPIERHHEHEEYRDRPHFLSSHRHRVLHQRNPANVPQYVEHCPAKAAPASSIDSTAIPARSLVLIRHLTLLKAAKSLPAKH